MRTTILAAIVLAALPVWGAAPKDKLSNEANAIVTGTNDFAIDMYRQLAADDKGNVFFSPASVHTALSMTQAGAGGDTAVEMAKVLQLPKVKPSDLAMAYGQLIDAINAIPEIERKPAYQLNVANALWLRQGMQFNKDFTGLADKDFHARATLVDFTKAEAAAKTINDWVEDKTNKRIKDLISKDALGADTAMVLTNAVYFKADWMDKFKQDETQDAPFKLGGEKTVKAPMMARTGSYRYAENDDLQLLEMPYATGKLSMIVILPKKVDGLAAVEKALSAEQLAKWAKDASKEKVQLKLPRWKATQQFELNKVLEAMGMKLAFDPAQADFSPMVEKAQMKLFISRVVHKSFVDVTEEGTEAAAATGVAMGMTAMPERHVPKVFTADHPFLYMIRHNDTGVILFMGRLTDPTGKGE